MATLNNQRVYVGLLGVLGVLAVAVWKNVQPHENQHLICIPACTVF
jgi:hypothetical protein